MLKGFILRSTLFTLICAVSFAARAMADQSVRVDVPAGDLSAALATLAKQSGVEFVYQADQVRGLRTGGVKGDYTAEAAVRILLKATPLEIRVDPSGALLIAPPGPKTRSGAQERGRNSGGRQRRSDSPGAFLLAQAGQHPLEASGSLATGASEREPPAAAQLGEVVVTAEKRSERLLDVPMALSALGGGQLERSQAFQLQEYAGKVPGLTLIENGALGSQLVIRGLTTGVGAVNSLVATYVDETPYTTEGPFAASFIATPNIDTFDMARIEVLRGPQGTLYGANALGGILKYVTNAPDPSGSEAKVEVSGNRVDHGGSGFDIHGMVNAPITENLALRAVAYEDYYPGFIDDPVRGLQDVNGARVAGGRVSLQYQPTADLTVRLNTVYQERRWKDWGTEDVAPTSLTPLYGELTHENLESQPGSAATQLYNVTAKWNAGFASLVSATSYYDERIPYAYDYSKLLGTVVSGILGGTYGLNLDLQYRIRAFTQELRLSSPEGDSLRWLVGAYFTNEHAQQYEYLYPIDPATHTLVYDLPNLGSFDIPTSYREYAGFVNLDYHLTKRFDVGVGGRYSENRQKFHETAFGIFGGGLNFGNPSSQGVVTYSADASWHFLDQHMLYGRIASGYSPGGPNNAITTAIVPSSYEASTSINYEVGLKSSMLENRINAEITAFVIEWRKLQLNAFIGGESFTTNAGGARSEGVEWDFSYAPVRALTIHLNGAYTDAYLTEQTPASVNGHVGERLPAVPMWQGSAGAEYRWPASADWSGLAGVDWRLSSSRYADFEAIGPRQQMPSFSLFDLRAGIQSARWEVMLFARNLFDKLAINYVQSEAGGGFGDQSATVYPPRTYGLTVTTTF